MANSYFIVDDHEMLRSGIIGWLKDNTDYICFGDSGTLQTAMDTLVQLEEKATLPDILISDINFNGENSGFNLIAQVHEKYPQIKIVVYSMFYSPIEMFLNEFSFWLVQSLTAPMKTTELQSVLRFNTKLQNTIIENKLKKKWIPMKHKSFAGTHIIRRNKIF